MAALVRDWGGYSVTLTLASPFAVPAGNTLVIAMSGDYFDSVSDARGNTYYVDSAGGSNDGANFLGVGHVYITTPLQVNDNITFATHFGGSASAVAIAEFSGIGSGNAADVITNSTNGASTTVVGAATGALGFAADLYVAAVTYNTAPGTITDNTPTGLIPLAGAVIGGGKSLWWRYKFLTSNASVGYNATIVNSVGTGVVVATYKTVAAPPAAAQIPGPAPLLGRFG